MGAHPSRTLNSAQAVSCSTPTPATKSGRLGLVWVLRAKAEMSPLIVMCLDSLPSHWEADGGGRLVPGGGQETGQGVL